MATDADAVAETLVCAGGSAAVVVSDDLVAVLFLVNSAVARSEVSFFAVETASDFWAGLQPIVGANTHMARTGSSSDLMGKLSIGRLFEFPETSRLERIVEIGKMGSPLAPLAAMRLR